MAKIIKFSVKIGTWTLKKERGTWTLKKERGL